MNKGAEVALAQLFLRVRIRPLEVVSSVNGSWRDQGKAECDSCVTDESTGGLLGHSRGHNARSNSTGRIMKKYVVTAASILAGLSMVSGAAYAQTGSVGVNAVRVDTDFGDADAYGVDGEVIFAAGGGWSTILEGSFTDVDGGDSATAVQGHLVNLSGNSAWGGFVGVTDTDGSTVFAIGGEYAQFFDASTLAFNVNYGNDDDANVDAYGISGAYRIFGSDNLRFDIGASLGRAESGGLDADITSVGVGVEYRFDNSPFSVGAAYSRVDGDIAEANVFGLTARWNFGDQTLKAADRAGKTFTGLGTALQTF